MLINNKRSTLKKRIIRSFISIIAAVTIIAGSVLFVIWIVVAQPIFSKGGNLSDKNVDPQRLEQHVKMLSREFYPRDYKNMSNLDRCADYIMENFKLAGASDAGFQEFDVMGKRYKNVTAFFDSTSEERIVIGAHYDAFNDTPGADDNASGVAGIIEMARLLSANPLGRDVELVAFVLEEPPFFTTNEMGSFKHAEKLAGEDVQVKLMIALEMIGYFDDAKGSQNYPMPLLKLLYPGRGNYISLVSGLDQRGITRSMKNIMAGATDLPVHSINAPSFIAGIDFSDHRSYWLNGYKGIMVTDTAFYRNRAYHEKKDTADRLDYERMAKVVTGVYEAVRMLP